jgi:hypothetical protein
LNLSQNERTLLLGMHENCASDYEEWSDGLPGTFYGFKALAKMSALPDNLTRRTVRALARKGYAGFMRGLMNEEGEVRGSGYGITNAGRERAKEELANERPANTDA